MTDVYICEICSKEFKVKFGLTKHKRIYHPEVFVYECKICGELAETLKGFLIHVTKKHNNAEEYFNKFLLGKEKCRYDHCDKLLEYNNRYSGCYCSQNHYESQLRINNDIKLNSICEICGAGYETVGRLQRHLTSFHNYDSYKIKEYYDNYFKKIDDGYCLYCSKKMEFTNSFSIGYNRFCYNTDCNVRWYNENTNRLEDMGTSLKLTHKNNPNISPVKKEYWMSKGYSEENAIKQVSQRQKTFSKDICIKKYGEIEGIARWKKRQEKWLNSYPKQNYSKISQELFWNLYDEIKNKYRKIYFASLNKGICDYSKNREYRIETKNSFRLLDFYIEDINKCIEFDGTYWHGVIGRGNISRDECRMNDILDVNPNIVIFRVKEFDYNKDKEKVIQDCLEFING